MCCAMKYAPTASKQQLKKSGVILEKPLYALSCKRTQIIAPLGLSHQESCRPTVDGLSTRGSLHMLPFALSLRTGG
jgi:hypothetical protein